jgi:GT2 family glycosyltransferase
LEQVGLLDEDYFMYTEEVDLCYRIRKAGGSLIWVPAAHVTHYGGQSTRQVALEMFLQLYASKITYFRKQHGPLAAAVYKAILWLVSLVRVAVGSLVSMGRPTHQQHYQTLTTNYRRLLAALSGM